MPIYCRYFLIPIRTTYEKSYIKFSSVNKNIIIYKYKFQWYKEQKEPKYCES